LQVIQITFSGRPALFWQEHQRAYEIGYEDIQSFSRFFKKMEGVSFWF
jgi:hypothetical protein